MTGVWRQLAKQIVEDFFEGGFCAECMREFLEIQVETTIKKFAKENIVRVYFVKQKSET